jgi:hypothetical protein
MVLLWIFGLFYHFLKRKYRSPAPFTLPGCPERKKPPEYGGF